MKLKNPDNLRDLIKDHEISNFIFQPTFKKNYNTGFFKREKYEDKRRYITEINHILDKMDVWGK